VAALGIRLPRGRRRRIVTIVAVVGALLLLWVPSLVASHYSFSARPTDFLTRPDKGWAFLYEVMTQSRGVDFGSTQAAEDLAVQKLWVGPPARATSVRLVYLEGPFRVPVPPGGVEPAPGQRIAHPRSPLSWVVYGGVQGHHTIQMIGLLDYRYHAGARPTWDIRRGLRRAEAR
jgi:hypothetical protein